MKLPATNNGTSPRTLALLLAVGLMLAAWSASAQRLITMSNKCVERVENGQAALDVDDYQGAIAHFSEVLDKCSAKDGKEAGNVGLAMAYNGLGQYDKAIEHANAALEVSKNTNINAFFARGVAHNGMKQSAEAQADFNQIIALTEKNQNVKERATIFAEVADLSRQQGMYDEALGYIDQAIGLDGQNPMFHAQRGDIFAAQGDLDKAFTEYDQAVALGMDGMSMYRDRAAVRMNALQEKYGTDKANELKANMTALEKDLLCADINKAFELGFKDMQLDLFRAMVCQ